MPLRVRSCRLGDDGYTLIEMLIAIVVMSVLVGIVVVGVAQFRGDSQREACKADAKIVKSAASAYELQRGSFPTSVSDLEAAGYVNAPPDGVTYIFDPGTKTVTLGSCNL